LQAQLYGASKKSIRAIESFACLGLSVDQIIHSENRLVIGPDTWNYREKERLDMYGNHDFFASHCDEIIEQSNFTCQRILDEDRVDTIVFPSAESVRVVTEQIAACHETPESLSTRARVICYGPSSCKAATELGYEVTFTLKEPTKAGLIELLKQK
jgi:uroporphyrinogen III methyltransferase/synthase